VEVNDPEARSVFLYFLLLLLLLFFETLGRGRMREPRKKIIIVSDALYYIKINIADDADAAAAAAAADDASTSLEVISRYLIMMKVCRAFSIITTTSLPSFAVRGI